MGTEKITMDYYVCSCGVLVLNFVDICFTETRSIFSYITAVQDDPILGHITLF